MTSQCCLALTVVPTNPARVTILWRKVFWIKVTFASITVLGHFGANWAGKSPSGEPAQVLSGQVLQPGGLLCLHWVSAWNHQGQFHFRPPGSGLAACHKNLYFLFRLFRSEWIQNSAPGCMAPWPMALQPVSGLAELATDVACVTRRGIVLRLKVVSSLAIRDWGLSTDEAEIIPWTSSLQDVFTRTLKVRVGLKKWWWP